MEELMPLTGRSPRALKRYVNVYRLIKVRWPDTADFMLEEPPIAPYRAVLFLLALAIGAPEEQHSMSFGSGYPLRTPEPWRSIPRSDLAPFQAEVARFSFR